MKTGRIWIQLYFVTLTIQLLKVVREIALRSNRGSYSPNNRKSSACWGPPIIR